MPILPRILCTLADFLILVLTAVLLVVLLTGGGQFRLAGTPLSVTSAGNPLSFLLVIGFLRWSLARRQPFFGFDGLRLDTLDDSALSLCRRLRARLHTLSDREAFRLVTAIAALSLLVRLANAYWHYGFFAGDDVEIHEMTLGTLFHEDWTVWQLRNSFYPMAFIFPAQFVLYQLGISEASNLVFAGRAVVAVISSSTLILLFAISKREFGIPVALLAVLLLAGSALHVRMGSTELPRPVAAFFLVLAFACMLHRSLRGSIATGVLLGVAGAMRFGEAIFVIPCLAGMLMMRRWRAAAATAAVFLCSWAAILGTADLFYWDSPLSSLAQAFDFTIASGLSSRGYEPFHFYFTHISAWSNLFTVGLGVLAFRFRILLPALWAWLPIAFLSLLPHKESRYLVPVLPFLALAAGAALWEVLQRCTMRGVRGRSMALALVVGGVAAAVFEVSGFRFPRSERSVDLAISLREDWSREGAAVEQVWRVGGRLYLPDVRVLDIPPEGLDESLNVIGAEQTVGWILLVKESVNAERLRLLRDSGYDEVQLSHPTYRVFRRRTLAGR